MFQNTVTVCGLERPEWLTSQRKSAVAISKINPCQFSCLYRKMVGLKSWVQCEGQVNSIVLAGWRPKSSIIYHQ